MVQRYRLAFQDIKPLAQYISWEDFTPLLNRPATIFKNNS